MGIRKISKGNEDTGETSKTTTYDNNKREFQ